VIWDRLTVTYCIEPTPPLGVSRETWRAAINSAYAQFSEVIPIRFVETSETSFGSCNWRWGIADTGTNLGLSSGPIPSGVHGQTFSRLSNRFIFTPVWMAATVIHEGMHGLGLMDHAPSGVRSVLLSGNRTITELTEWDKAKLREFHGAPAPLGPPPAPIGPPPANLTDVVLDFAAKALWERAGGDTARVVELLYETLAGRPSDPGGLKYWTERLK